MSMYIDFIAMLHDNSAEVSLKQYKVRVQVYVAFELRVCIPFIATKIACKNNAKLCNFCSEIVGLHKLSI